MKKLFKENDLVKFVSLAIFLTIILTWIIPGGSYTGTEFVKNEELVRTGLAELSLSGVYAISFFLQQIIFVLVIGAFYGVISITNGYRELVIRCAKFIKGKEIPVVLIVSGLIALFVSLSSQVFIVLLAIPFIITILLNAKLDKITAFIATFGSIFIGMIGASYGTEGLYYFNYYVSGDIKTGLSMRFAILAVAYVLFNLLNIKHIKKIVNSKNVDETKDDKFAIEKPLKKNVKIWPIIILLFVVFAFAILGYVRWEEQFEFTKFADFHEWLLGLKIGKHAVVSYILGGVSAFGTWELYSIFGVLLVVAILAKVIYKVSLDDFINGLSNGLSNMIRPVALMVLAYSIFVLVYWSPIVPTITNAILGSKFNSFSTTIAAAVSSFFTADFGYTGYTMGQFLVSAYADNLEKVFVIYPAMHGFVQMFAPSSVILLAGLSYSDISYKEWIKHIWKFILAMLIILLIIFAV